MHGRYAWRTMKLFNYFRSSASYRVRIALALKGLPYEYVPVHLVRAEHRAPGYADRVGDALVPALELGDGSTLVQSMAIIEYLDETHPQPPLLPGDALGRAHVRALAQMVACEIHPVNNLRVLKYLTQTLGHDDAEKTAWYRHWARGGLESFERQARPAGPRPGGGGPAAIAAVLGRCPDARRLLPGAADLQCAALRGRSGRAAAHHGGLGGRIRAAGFPGGPSFRLPRCRKLAPCRPRLIACRTAGCCPTGPCPATCMRCARHGRAA